MISDAFTIMDEHFRYWTGEDWTPDEERALAFPGPADGYDRASELAAFLHAAGHPCMPCYFPPRGRQVRKSTPRRDRRTRR
jgi:hypothetical protein